MRFFDQMQNKAAVINWKLVNSANQRWLDEISQACVGFPQYFQIYNFFFEYLQLIWIVFVLIPVSLTNNVLKVHLFSKHMNTESYNEIYILDYEKSLCTIIEGEKSIYLIQVWPFSRGYFAIPTIFINKIYCYLRLFSLRQIIRSIYWNILLIQTFLILFVYRCSFLVFSISFESLNGSHWKVSF